MIDIAANEIHKYYGANHVLKGITFEVYSGEKVGLLGKNGSGKTTLFKLITREEPFERGSLARASGKIVGMLAQIPEFGEGDSCEDVLRASFKEIAQVFTQMKKIEGDADPAVLERYCRLLEEYERLGGYDIEVKLDKVCNGMGIDERLRGSLFANLSGGEKTRVNLARILLRESDILLLDEPTNHLDLASLEWLENFLRDYAGTIVVVSHDRVFLDRVVTRIIEIEDGRAQFYSGNYTFYSEERQRRFLTQAELYKQQQRKIQQLETAIRRQRVWAAINPSNTGLAKRALAMEKRVEQMDKVDRPVTERKLAAGFDSGGYAAKVVASFDRVYKSYGAKVILEELSLKIHRNERIALVGANGCGKTTLLKMLTGEEQPDSGEIKVSPSVKAAYMSQIITFEDMDATVLDTLRYAADVPVEKARSILAGFHFKAADVMKKVGVLSGGEKSRLRLCMMMQQNVNFLLLDEPTNHLDIASREWIENALADFEGTMLFVSHDRYFLNQFADRVWSMENGAVIEYDCGFEEYLETTRPAAVPKEKSAQRKPIPSEKAPPPAPRTVPTEELIREAEAELQKVNAAIDYDLQQSDFTRMHALHEEKGQLEERIDLLYDKWAEDR
ncbi:MAG: ABC-F type ribosomal protection protein [Firmicutes bacterium]|nr:ABC-F type ribosomal protection protein [Bacillota bacterium]